MKYSARYLLGIVLHPIRTADKLKELQRENIRLRYKVHDLRAIMPRATKAREALVEALDRYNESSNRRIADASIAGRKISHDDKLRKIREQAEIERNT